MFKNFSEDIFTVEVEVTPKCNYTCEFCENSKGDFTSDKFDIDFNALLQFLKYLKTIVIGKPISLILNGGEPTLHKSLFIFCKNIQTENINVQLLTNLSTCDNLYKNILSFKNISVIPTYHKNNISETEFIEKMDRLGLTALNMSVKDIADYIKFSKIFQKYQVNFQLLENYDYGDSVLNELTKIDKNILGQYLIKMSQCGNCKNPKICCICKKYVYVNGDGSIMACMFNKDLDVIGNIKNKDSYNNINLKKYIICRNSYCFYK